MARDDDDDSPKKKPPAYPPISFEPLGIEELRDYITWLKEQIQLTEEAITQKKSAQAAAQLFFKPTNKESSS